LGYEKGRKNVYLTAVFKLRTTDHQAALLVTALHRWGDAFRQAHGHAEEHQRVLLRCITARAGKDGKIRLRVDSKALHGHVVACCRGIETHLHSSASMSLIVALEEMLGSWLALHAEWAQGGRTTPKPAFPTLPALTDRQAQATYDSALRRFAQTTTLSEERKLSTQVQRAARDRCLPMYFGAAAAGGETGTAHCGLLKRPDGNFYALLAFWGQGDRHGAPVRVAPNRAHVPAAANVRSSTVPFTPTAKSRAGLLLPLEMGRRHEQRIYLSRGVPKSAELVQKRSGFYLHVAFQFPDRAAAAVSNVLAIRRGITTLCAAVTLSPEGREMHRSAISGNELVAVVTAITKQRAIRQAKGKSTAGDRRAARIAEHHLYSAAHQIVGLAREQSAQVVMLEDRNARKPQPLLRYKHWSKLAEITGSLCARAGVEFVGVKPVYGSLRTCPACAWHPGAKKTLGDADESTPADTCPTCGALMDREFHPATLLGLDTLRSRIAYEKRPKLMDFIAALRSGG